MSRDRSFPEDFWPLDPTLVFLNHGSFGSSPRPVLAAQAGFRARLEADPIQFLGRDLESLLDCARSALAAFVGCSAEDLVSVQNATTGVNTVLRSLEFEPGQEIVVTDHEYNACRNALDYVAAKERLKVVVASVPFPLSHPDQAAQPILDAVTPRTRLALLDHVTSATGLILPLEQIIPALTSRGVETLVDGAHAPGMIPLNLKILQPTYYTGNCHKWLCGPKVSGFLYVSKSSQEKIRPLVISHGANSRRSDRSRFLIEFAWVGTSDPSAFLSVPVALESLGGLLPGGWPEIMRGNRALALEAQNLLSRTLQIPVPAPASMIGSLAALPIPGPAKPSISPLYLDPLQERLREKYRIEVPIIPWRDGGERLVRISAQLYNDLPQYQLLADALLAETKFAGR